MDQQVPEQEQDDSEYCTCDACARELRQASEKEALETAAKQRLTYGAFSGGEGAGEWVEDLTDDTTNFPSRFFPSTEDHPDRVHSGLKSRGIYEEQPDAIRYRVPTGNVVKFGPGAAIEGVYLPPTRSINVTGIPLHRSHSDVLTALKETLEDGGLVEADISISDLRRVPNSPHQTATIHVGNHDPKHIVSKLDGVELFGRNISSRLFTPAYPNQMEDVSPTERNVVYIHWRAPEVVVAATFKSSALAIAWCEEHDYDVINGRTIRARVHRSLKSHFKKIAEIQNLPLDISPQRLQELLPDDTSISFHLRNAYNVDKTFDRLRKDVDAIAGQQLRDYRLDKSKMPSGWLGVRVQCYTWDAAQRIRDSLSQRRRWQIGGRRLFVTLEDPYRYSISIEPRQYHAQQKLLQSIWDTHRGGPSADIRIITGTPGQDIRVEVYGSNELAVGVLKARVEEIIRGKFIPGCHSLFGSNENLETIRDISVETGCFIRFNNATQTITAFGDDDTLRAFSERLQLHIENTTSSEIELTDSTVSAFCLRRGIPLLGSVVGEENVCVTMEHPHPILTVRGGGDEVAHMLRWFCDEGIEDFESTAPPPDTMCPVCLDYPEAYFRLECGHFYCYTCLKHFLTTGITDKHPVLGCAECLTPISVDTLRKVLPRSELEDLLELAFNTYVHTCPEKFKFCGTPHCTRFYQLAPKDSEDPPEFRCPTCLRSVCSGCQGASHEGTACLGRGVHRNAGVEKADP